MRTEQLTDQEIRVIPQLTISKRIISLVAEEDSAGFIKGQIVKRITPASLAKMSRPLKCRVTKRGGCTYCESLLN